MSAEATADTPTQPSKEAGRPAGPAMERLIRIMISLNQAGAQGRSGKELLEVAGFTSQAESAARQLSRDINHLKASGWEIENIGEEGVSARYRMVNVDNRLKLNLHPSQLRQLYRAALVADGQQLAQRLGVPQEARVADVEASLGTEVPPQVGQLLAAIRDRCQLRFSYATKPRQAVPVTLGAMRGSWYLQAQETGSDLIKTFAVSRMDDLQVEAPGTAPAVTAPSAPNLNPLRWSKDDPEPLQVRCRPVFEAEVVRSFGTPVARKTNLNAADGAPEMVELHYESTNHAAVFQKLVALDTRVVLAGSDQLRTEFFQFLRTMAGESADVR